MQSFRFAIHTHGRDTAEGWAAFARRVEELGYHALYMPDHFGRQLAPIAGLAAAAGVTRDLRIGSCVFANDFRHPLLLAREAATLDVLSGGRFDFGLGAGWRVSDYRQQGLAYDRPGLRIERMAEALEVILRLFAGETVTHRGPHYVLDRARLSPMPVQRPRPRLMLGGGGPRFLRLAASAADIVSFIPGFAPDGRPLVSQVTDAALARKVAIVRHAAGDRLDALELSVWIPDVGVVGGASSLGGSLASAVKAVGPALVGGSPFLMYGTPAQLRERLLRRREALGISSYVIPDAGMEAFAPVAAALSGA
jgi:probable F420-dependent oxidoreductase